MSKSAPLVYLVNIVVKFRYRRLLHMFMAMGDDQRSRSMLYNFIKSIFKQQMREFVDCGPVGVVFQGFKIDLLF